MGDYKFFYPNGEEIEGGSSQNGFHNFIKFYSRAYYYTCSRFVEDEIDRLLAEGIREKMDVVHIMAWKLGKIKVKSSTSEKPFVYKGDWKSFNAGAVNWDEVKAENYGEQFPIKELAEFVCQAYNMKYIENDDEAVAFVDQISKYNGIGSVYAIALLYFLSKGKYPIYDRFATRGLAAIEAQKKPREEFSPIIMDINTEDIMKEGSPYMEYAREIWDIEKCLQNYDDLKKRDLDRALWTYGHLFNA